MFSAVDKVFTPPFVRLLSADTAVMLRELRQAGVDFPVVCKAQEAHGSSEAHRMMIIFNADGLQSIKVPCVAQTFVNHDAVLYKVFVIGERFHIVRRPSFENFHSNGTWKLRCAFWCTRICSLRRKISIFFINFSNLSSYVRNYSFFYVYCFVLFNSKYFFTFFIYFNVWHVGLWYMPVRCRSPSHCIRQSEYYWLTVAGRSAGHSSADRRQLRPGRSHGHAGPRNCHFHRQGSAEAIRLVLNWNWFDRGQNDRPLRDYRRQCFSQYVTHRLIDCALLID